MGAGASALVEKLNRILPLKHDELASLAGLEARRRPIIAHTELRAGPRSGAGRDRHAHGELANASVKMSHDPLGTAVEARRHGLVEGRNRGIVIRRDLLSCRLWKNLIGSRRRIRQTIRIHEDYRRTACSVSGIRRMPRTPSSEPPTFGTEPVPGEHASDRATKAKGSSNRRYRAGRHQTHQIKPGLGCTAPRCRLRAANVVGLTTTSRPLLRRRQPVRSKSVRCCSARTSLRSMSTLRY